MAKIDDDTIYERSREGGSMVTENQILNNTQSAMEELQDKLHQEQKANKVLRDNYAVLLK